MLRKLLVLVDITAIPKLVCRNWYLLCQMVRRNVELRYKGSFLGVVWSIVQPLMMLTVYTFVFSEVFKPRWETGVGDAKGEFAVLIFCGMAIYSIFSESVNASCGIVVNSPNFVKKVVFPVEILPLSQVVSSFIIGSLWFVLLLGGVVYVLGSVHWTMLLLPVVLIPLFLCSLGVSFLVASLGVYLRDTQYIVGVIFQVLYFVTPIFYPISAVPERFRIYLEANPLAMMINEARQMFLYGHLPNWTHVGIAFVVSLVIMQLGYAWFVRTRKGFADVL